MTNDFIRPRAVLAVALAAIAALTAADAFAGAAVPRNPAAAQGVDLWGGPGARGAGALGARFDTRLYVTNPGTGSVTGQVFYHVGGTLAATTPFTLGALGVAVLETPTTLEGRGAWLFRVKTSSPVSAWSETYNSASVGQFGVSLDTFPGTSFLEAGDEAMAGGAEASTSFDPGRSRTNVGVLCSPEGVEGCSVEVSAFEAGGLLGMGTVTGAAGSAAQVGLADLVPGTAGHVGLSLRLRVRSGRGRPYVVKVVNATGDGTSVPTSETRGAFSAAPTVTKFEVDPSSGCPEQTFTLTWATEGAQKVSIPGVSTDLPTSGTATTTFSATTDVVLSAIASSGATTVVSRRANIVPATQPPTPVPESTTLNKGGFIEGLLPAGLGAVSVQFDQQESTGSTFEVVGNSFQYHAGTVAGIDRVRITATSACGSASAVFTATVVEPGAPAVIAFNSNPSVGCGTSNISLGWVTANTDRVVISGVPDVLSPNGAVPTTITGPTTFTLTAFGFQPGKKATATLFVPVDPQPYTPVITPAGASMNSGDSVNIFVTPGSVPDLSLIRFVFASNQSRGSLRRITFSQYLYTAGPNGGLDAIRFFYTNGCGAAFTTFSANVTATGP